jgi:parvulin-like peptidyl-prolyl isomerase
MKCRPRLLLLSAAFMISFIACRSGNQEEVVARVGKSALTLQQIREETPGIATAAARAQAELYIQRWIQAEVLYQEARRREVDKQPRVRAGIQEMVRDFVVSSYLDQAVYGSVSVSDAEIQSYYQEQKDEFQTAEDLYHLWISLVADLNEANRLRTEIKNGAPFNEIASSYSLDGTRAKGGDMGYVALSTLSPRLAGAATAMRKGDLSLPVKSELGYNLLRLDDMQPRGTLRPIEAVRHQIEQRIVARKNEEKYQRLISKLTEEASLYTDLSKLDKINTKE